MMYGKEIGRKFYEDGSVRRYPGNTVVANLTPLSPEFQVMTYLRSLIIGAGFDKTMILLPECSYHMTVIRGVNDQVRTDDYWPKTLPKDSPMDKVDDYMTAAIGSVEMPKKIRMKFDRVRFSATAMLVTLLPADDTENRILRDYRDKVANAIGLFLPKHDEYRFHITLAYTRIIPEGDGDKRMKELIAQMDTYLAAQPEFEIKSPFIAYYDDMLEFHSNRIPR